MTESPQQVYLTHLHAYARWWRETSATRRRHEAPARLATARAASLWYEEHQLDAQAPVPHNAPVTTRTMLQRHAGAFVGDVRSIAQGGYLGRTSGSTGEPVEVLMCAWALAHYYMHLEWGFERAGYTLPTRARVSYISMGSRAAPGEEAAPLWGGRVARMDGATAAEIAAHVHTFAPHIVSCAPGDLARCLDERAHQTWSSVHVIVTTSEHCSPELRARVREVLSNNNLIILDSYGLSEIGPVAWRCPHDEHAEVWHVPAGSACVERIKGELVVTTWRNRAMPLTRYATGDGVAWVSAHERCARCGHEGQSFGGLLGRQMMTLCDAQGARLSPVLWLRTLNEPRFEVTRHHLKQDAPGELAVTYSATCGEAMERELHRVLRAHEPSMKVHITRT